jgi:hypothetical protein
MFQPPSLSFLTGPLNPYPSSSMSPARLIQLVESNWETIAGIAIKRVHTDPEVPNYKALTDIELRSRACDLLSHLGHWLAKRDPEILARRYEDLGRQRFDEGMPLHEVIYKLQLLKRVVYEHARDQHLEVTAIELYAEQEFLGLIDEFFDRIIFRVCKGYSEQEMKHPSSSLSDRTPKHRSPVLH